MNFYPFHIGDYATHTAHLEPMEDLAYRRMLDLYYLREGPLPVDVQEVARLVRLRQHAEAVEAVLREFFDLTDTGWVNERCEAELAHATTKREKARASAMRSVAVRTANAEPALSERSTNAERTLSDRSATNTNPNTNPSSSSSKKSAPVAKPTDVSPEVWQSFLTVRKAKKAAVTDLAMLGIRREAVTAGITLEQALTMCCERGWAGFKAEWLQNQQLPRFERQDIARVTVPGRQGPDPALVKIEEDRKRAVPPPLEVLERMAKLRMKA